MFTILAMIRSAVVTDDHSDLERWAQEASRMSDKKNGLVNRAESPVQSASRYAQEAKDHVSVFNPIQRVINSVRTDMMYSDLARTLQNELKRHIQHEVQSRFEAMRQQQDLMNESVRQEQIMRVGADLSSKASEISVQYSDQMGDYIEKLLDQNERRQKSYDERLARGGITPDQHKKLTLVLDRGLDKFVDKQASALDRVIDERINNVIDLLTK